MAKVQPYKYILQGVAGSGKSTLGNKLMEYVKQKDGARMLRSTFGVSAEAESKTMSVQTQQTTSYIFEDHPGMNDTFGSDNNHEEALIESMKTEDFSVILFIVPSENARFSEPIIKRIMRLVNLLGPNILNHCAIITTKFHQKNKHNQIELMCKTLSKVYEVLGLLVPSQHKLSQRVFCMDCEPEKTCEIYGLSHERLQELEFDRSLVCELIIQLSDILKSPYSYQPAVAEPPTTKFLSSTASLSNAAEHKYAKRSFNPITNSTILSNKRLHMDQHQHHQQQHRQQQHHQQPIKMAFEKQKTHAYQRHLGQFMNDEQEEPEVKKHQPPVAQFVNEFGIVKNQRGFIGSKVLEQSWNMFQKTQKQKCRQFKIKLAEYFPNMQHMKEHKFCERCLKLRKSPTLAKAGLLDFCSCATRENFFRKTIIVGISSPRLNISNDKCE